VRKYDELGPNKSDKALQEFINQWRPYAPRLPDVTYEVRPARLRHAINHCGESGNRPRRAFRSRRGKGCRRRLHGLVHETLDDAVIFYWSERKRTYQAAWDHFVVQMARINQQRAGHGEAPLEIPARAETLRKRISFAECHATWAMKYSKREADLRFRGVKEGLKASEPLELVTMDHTIVDNCLVLDSAVRLPLGRPTLTVAIDVYARMVLGYLVSFEPASLYSVLTTLKRVNKNKHYVQTLYPEITRKWDGWGRPQNIVVDQAWEFKSPSFQDALADLGIGVTWAPVNTPQYKAIGERFFQTLNTKLFHRIEGGVPYDPRKMRALGLDPTKDAIFTIADLDELIHRTLDNYHYDMHSGIGAVPTQVWRDKIREGRRHFVRDIAALDDICGAVHDAVLTRRGIRFKNMTFHDEPVTTYLLQQLVEYESKRAQSDKPFSSARARIKIKYNPVEASSVSVWNRAGTPPHYITLRNADADYASGLSYWHHRQVRAYAKREGLRMCTEYERCWARDALRQKWEALAGSDMPLRDKRDAHRSLAFSQGTFDDKLAHRDEVHQSGPYASDLPSVTLVPDGLPAPECQDGGERPKGRAPSRATLQGAKKAAQERRREQASHRAEEQHEREVSRDEPDGASADSEAAQVEGRNEAEGRRSTQEFLKLLKDKSGWS
jgi:putative transposase